MERQMAAAAALEEVEKDPTYLQRVVFLDEAKIWLTKRTGARRKVWVDAHDQGVRHVLRAKKLPKGVAKLCLHFYVAVNAQLGAFFFQFTTGTTDITRDYMQLHLKLNIPEDGEYRVSHMAFTGLKMMQPAGPSVIWEPGSALRSKCIYSRLRLHRLSPQAAAR